MTKLLLIGSRSHLQSNACSPPLPASSPQALWIISFDSRSYHCQAFGLVSISLQQFKASLSPWVTRIASLAHAHLAFDLFSRAEDPDWSIGPRFFTDIVTQRSLCRHQMCWQPVINIWLKRKEDWICGAWSPPPASLLLAARWENKRRHGGWRSHPDTRDVALLEAEYPAGSSAEQTSSDWQLSPRNTW